MSAVTALDLDTNTLYSGMDVINQENIQPFNYIFEIQKLVAQLLTAFGKISANDQSAIKTMKDRFTHANLQSTDLQRDYGKVNRNIHLASIALLACGLFFPNADDKQLISLTSTHLPQLGGMSTAMLQAKMSEKTAESQLALEQYRDKTAKQSGGNAKQEVLSLLQSANEGLKNASRAG
ncbi:MAG TPA: hypothetical protein VLE95_03475 [Chlamydiales bacterium]|nr:hypothetical protein [Chlamydiales bacterium]